MKKFFRVMLVLMSVVQFLVIPVFAGSHPVIKSFTGPDQIAFTAMPDFNLRAEDPLTFKVEVEGGNPPYTYMWSNGGTVIETKEPEYVTNLAGLRFTGGEMGGIWVQVVDSSGKYALWQTMDGLGTRSEFGLFYQYNLSDGSQTKIYEPEFPYIVPTGDSDESTQPKTTDMEGSEDSLEKIVGQLPVVPGVPADLQKWVYVAGVGLVLVAVGGVVVGGLNKTTNNGDQSKDPNTKVLSDGSVATLLPDGSRTMTLPDGTKGTFLPDGTEIYDYPDKTREIDNADGTSTRIDPDGTRVDRHADGSQTISNLDKTKTTIYTNGNMKTVDKNGNSKTYDKDNNVIEVETAEGFKGKVGPDGNMTMSSPYGGSVKINKKGEVTEGTINTKDGSWTFNPDGSEKGSANSGEKIEIDSGGNISVSDKDGSSMKQSPNGDVKIDLNDSQKRIVEINSNGSVTASNNLGDKLRINKDGSGSFETREGIKVIQGADGKGALVLPDGSNISL